jgi:ABC-type phosphate/phosphonate transport system ATPase subunit
MIIFESVTITYPDAEWPAIRDVELSIPDGELVLVIGRTGAGKSTLLKAIRRANLQTSSDTSVRIRLRASSPTASKKNSRMQWNPWASRPQ